MNRNIIRPTVIGIAAGVVTVFAIAAWDELDPLHELQRLRERLRMSPQELAEFDRLEAERRELDAERRREHAEYVARVRAKFCPDLLAVSTAKTLEDLTAVELLAEIGRAQGEKFAAWNARPVGYGHPAQVTATVWADQLSALRKEFDERRWGTRRRTVGLVDRLRLDNAYGWVYDHTREIPPIKPYTPPTIEAFDDTGVVDAYPSVEDPWGTPAATEGD
ncbi:hypothetical protein [Nocardia sp. NPDC050710]|uniref:hypothetical protein n=1 Tax=Nocardia sp. NPDC050710 TaxID=3157220 RepID=UPI0033F89111